MNTEQMKYDVNRKQESLSETIQKLYDFHRVLSELSEKHLACVSSLSLGGEPFGLFLYDNAKPEDARSLVSALVRITGVQGKKTPSWEKTQIFVVFEGPEIPTFKVYGYTPPTCRKVTITRVIPAEPERVMTYETIVCDGGDLDREGSV